MNIYKIHKDGHIYLADEKDQDLKGALWVDIENPSDADIDVINAYYKLNLPSAKAFMHEVAIRRFELYGETHVFVPRLLCQNASGEHYTAPVVFMVHDDFFISFRENRPDVIDSFNRIITTETIKKVLRPVEVFYFLMFNLFRDYNACCEDMSDTLNQVAKEVFSEDLDGQNSVLHKTQIDRIARTEYLNGRILNSLMGLSLMGDYFESIEDDLRSPYSERFESNVNSLIENCTIIADRIDFVLNAVLSVINLEQNRVVNVFSVFTVIFTIPAVLVGLWGMNFKYMPGLSWQWGFFVGLLIIIISGVLPYWYVRKKGWL